jgi:hypothetical protein
MHPFCQDKHRWPNPPSAPKLFIIDHCFSRFRGNDVILAKREKQWSETAIRDLQTMVFGAIMSLI